MKHFYNLGANVITAACADVIHVVWSWQDVEVGVSAHKNAYPSILHK